MDMWNGLIALAACLGISLAAAYHKDGSFSMHTFLIAFAIGIAILIWIPILPHYAILLSIICLALVLFSDQVGLF